MVKGQSEMGRIRPLAIKHKGPAVVTEGQCRSKGALSAFINYLDIYLTCLCLKPRVGCVDALRLRSCPSPTTA